MIIIHHNPDCGTSRNTLDMIRASGSEPVIIEYLKIGWTKPYLQTLFSAAGLTPKQAMRVSGAPAESLGLTAEGVSDDLIIEAMIAHPVLVNRPFVVTPKGTRLCRPSELVFELLDNPPTGFTKEDGQQV
jgi:arsenate reductase (glutaredoxin)